MPAGYLAKVLQGLSRAGLLHSQRGLGGGFTLARSPNQLTMWEVVQAVDPLRRIRECPLGFESHETLCPLHEQLDSAIAAIDNLLKGAASQAVQNLNRVFGLPETEGLL